MDRQPCPYRIFDDIGTAFTMGTVGGGAYQLFSGFRNAPRGERIKGSLSACGSRASVYGGQFAVWGGLFSCCECFLLKIRKKEDSYNSMIAGFFSGAAIAWRGGFGVAIRNGIFGSIFLALLEGISLSFGKRQAANQIKEQIPSPPQFGSSYLSEDQRRREFDFIKTKKFSKDISEI